MSFNIKTLHIEKQNACRTVVRTLEVFQGVFTNNWWFQS